MQVTIEVWRGEKEREIEDIFESWGVFDSTEVKVRGLRVGRGRGHVWKEAASLSINSGGG